MLSRTAQKHVDQGISFELCITSDETTRDLQRYIFICTLSGDKNVVLYKNAKVENRRVRILCSVKGKKNE